MGQEEPLPPACEEHPGERVGMLLGWWGDQIQGWLRSRCSDTNEPKVAARTIIVTPAISSDLSSQEHTLPASPEVSMLIPDWLWDTIQQQENQESRRRPESLPLPHPARNRGPSPPAQPPPLTTPMMTAAPKPPITLVTATTHAGPGSPVTPAAGVTATTPVIPQ